MNKKFHIEATTSNLSDLLADFGATLSETCLLYSSTEIGSPYAAIGVKEVTATQVIYSVVCSRPATGLILADFVVTGPVTPLELIGGPQIYVLVLTRTGFGTVSVSLPDAFATDPEGNSFPAISPVTVELVRRPVPTISGPVEVGFVGVTLSVEFDEAVTGLTLGDFSVVDGTLTDLLGSGTSYTVTLTVAEGETDTQVMLPAYRVINGASQPNISSNVYRPIVAHTRPTPTITATQPTFGTLSTTFLITWSIDVSSGFVVGMLAATNGNVLTMTQLSDTAYLVDVEATGAGTVTLEIAQDEFTLPGYAGNAADTASCLVDLTALTFTLSAVSVFSTRELSVTVVGSQPHYGISLSAFEVVNAEAVGWTPSGNGGTLLLVVTEFPGTAQIRVRLLPGAVRTEAGYNLGSNTVISQHDSVRPTVTISPPVRQGSQYVFTLTSDELITYVAGVTSPAGSVAVTGSGYAWTATVTPTLSVGVLSLVVIEGAFADLAANPCYAANSGEYPYDLVGPVGTLELVADGHTLDRPTNKTQRQLVVTFDKLLLTDLEHHQVQLSAGTQLIDFEVIVPQTQYGLVVETTVPNAMVTVTIPAGAVMDTEGNFSQAPSVVAYVFDGVAPTYLNCTITDGRPNITWAFDLSETIVLDDYANRILTLGVEILEVTASGAAIFVVGRPTITGNVGVKLLRGLAKDLADNQTPETGFFYIAADATGPTTTITSTQSPSTSSRLITFKIEFSELLDRDLVREDLAIVNAVLNPVTVPGTKLEALTSRRVYEAVVGAIVEGPVTLSIAADRIHDLRGNGNSAASLTVGYSASFSVFINTDTNEYPDQRVLSLASSLPINAQTYSVDDYQVSSSPLGRVKELNNNKVLLIAPGSTSTTLTLPSGAVSSTSGKLSQATSITLDYPVMSTVATLTSDTPEAIVHTPVEVIVEFSTYVERVDIEQFQAAIRTDDLVDVVPSILSGEFTAFEVIEPGYVYKLTYVGQTYPVTLENDLHIWHEAANYGTMDIAGNKVTHQGYVRIPLRRPFAGAITSSQAPETFDQLITFDIKFPSQLTADLDITDLLLVNATTGGPGTGLTVGDDNSEYTLVVQATSAGNVQVTIPASVVTNLGGEANVASSLIVFWIGSDKYPMTIDIGPGAYTDQRLVTVRTSYPMDHAQVTLGSLNYNDDLITLVARGPMQFDATLKPGVHSASIVIPENIYTAYDGRRNHRTSATVSWSITNTSPRITILEPSLNYPNAINFTIDWPVKVFNFDATNIVASLRDGQLAIVPGGNTSGTLDATTELVPGYRHASKFTLDAAPDNTPHRFYIWCGPPWDITDGHGNPLTQPGYASVPVAGQFVFDITSPESPATGKESIRFDIRSNRPLAQDLAQTALSVVNGSITSFRPVTRLSSYSAWVRPTIKGDVTLTVEAGEITDTAGTPNQESSLTVQYDGSFTVGFAFEPGPYDDVAKVVLTLPPGVSDAPLDDASITFNTSDVAKVTRVIGEPAFLIHLKLPRNVVGSVVNIAVTLKGGELTAPDNSKNRSQLLTGTIPYVPFKVTPTFSPDPLEFEQTVTVTMNSNWYCVPDIASQVANSWFQYTNKLTGARITNASLIWTPGFWYQVVEGYQYAQTVKLHAPKDDNSNLLLPGGIPWYAEVTFSIISQNNIQGIYGVSRLNANLTTTERWSVPLEFPESNHTFSWIGGTSLTRHLIVTLEGSLGTQTDAFTVDWGDSSVEAFTRSQSHSWTTSSAVFYLSHTYASSAAFTVNIESADLSIRITGIEIAKPDAQNLLSVVSPGDPTIAGMTQIASNWTLDVRYLGLGNNTTATSSVLLPIDGKERHLRRLAANFYAADAVPLGTPPGDPDMSRLFNFYQLYIRTDQDVWRMLNTTSPSARPPVTNEVNLRGGWWNWSRTSIKLELLNAAGTSPEYPLVFSFADAVERIEVTGPVYWDSAGINAGVRPEWRTGPHVHNVILKDILSTQWFKLWEPPLAYDDRHVFELVSLTNCRFSRVIIPWKIERRRNNPWNPPARPLKRVELLDHWMSHEDEYQFYFSLKLGVMTDIDSLPLDAVVHTRRNPAMYGSPEANAPTSQTYSLVEEIRDILRRVGRPNAYRIILE